MINSTLVSIVCTTFNHEKYIKYALEGFVAQKTTFPFEIIVHDDASTDNTVAIIKEYQGKFPHLFRNIYQDLNQYSKGANIWEDLFTQNCSGKYIAICEGDDYWVDPLKLQKQVDFMERDSEFGLVHTNYYIVNSNNEVQAKYNHKWPSGDVFELIYKKTYHIVTPSVLFRKELFSKFGLNSIGLDLRIGDLPMWLAFSYVSKFKYLNDVTVVYRMLPNSASHSISLRKIYDFQYRLIMIRRKFASEHKLEFNRIYFYSRLYETMVKECYIKNDFKSALQFYRKMIRQNSLSLFKIKPLLFLLGCRFALWKNVIAFIYGSNK